MGTSPGEFCVYLTLFVIMVSKTVIIVGGIVVIAALSIGLGVGLSGGSDDEVDPTNAPITDAPITDDPITDDPITDPITNPVTDPKTDPVTDAPNPDNKAKFTV